MPRIFDNLTNQTKLIGSLKEALEVAHRADFCVGYFNLRGWKYLDCYIEPWAGTDDSRCRLLVGMQRAPRDELRQMFSLSEEDGGISNQVAIRLKKKLAEEFKDQLTVGAPTNQDEAGLRRLVEHLRAKKLVAKLFLKHPLHAKLYLTHRQDNNNPRTGYVGSSNLTFSGLSGNGELNVDVLDHDASNKLAKWFEDRWADKYCLDISDDLIEIIEESWAREDLIPPHHVYIKMAYHLSREAREGLRTFDIPLEMRDILYPFQAAAVKIAAHYLNKRGGVIIGDVVGLGKTLMATALAKMVEDFEGISTLIICPKNLEKMWQSYVDKYGMRAKVLPISRVLTDLADVPARFRLVLIDESHNLRNREAKRYAAIHEYIQQSGSKVILLSATPYNKTYLDLSNQLRLFVAEDADLGVRPEQYLRSIGGETEFIRRHQSPVRSLAAFENSEEPDDWRELMRLYLVRRTRTFIKENYAQTDPSNNRKYLLRSDGNRDYFPERVPKTAKFDVDDQNAEDQYAKLYSDFVVDIIDKLTLPRYGLGKYIDESTPVPPNSAEAQIVVNLSRAGERLKGFTRTNLFKRLESSGYSFLQSIERHVLRNCIYVYALENGLELPIGTQDVSMLDPNNFDEDSDAVGNAHGLFEGDNDEANVPIPDAPWARDEVSFIQRAEEVYNTYATSFARRFKWIRADLFQTQLITALKKDAQDLIQILNFSGAWDASKDEKLNTLEKLLTETHPHEKVLIFSQFADTVRYLGDQLAARNISKAAGVTGGTTDPTALAWRFSPVSNEKRAQVKPEDEVRVLVATDVLSEGQNLQDAHIVVNFDLPWAIIRLIQRAGRVDRIGQQAQNILCYTFLPTEGIERIISLRSRVSQRLKENADVVGADELFFEGDTREELLNLYNENAGILDDDPDTEVDLASYAYQIWQNAIEDDPELEKIISNTPPVIFSTKTHEVTDTSPEGVLVYMRTKEGNDALAWMDKNGNSVTESQFTVLRAAQCLPTTEALPRLEQHHELVTKGVELILEENRSTGGQLGRPSGARFRTYERLKNYLAEIKGTLFDNTGLQSAYEEIYKYPLYQSATDLLNRKLRENISNQDLAELVISLREDDRLVIIHSEEDNREPQIICSMGLVSGGQ